MINAQKIECVICQMRFFLDQAIVFVYFSTWYQECIYLDCSAAMSIKCFHYSNRCVRYPLGQAFYNFQLFLVS